MVQQKLSLGKFSGQVIGVDVDIDLELLGNGILNVLVELFVTSEESELVWRARLTATLGNFLHKHENLVNARNVLLHLAQVVLEHGVLDALGRLEPLGDACVLVADVALNDLLHGFDLVETVVEPDDLANQTGALGHQTLVDGLV